MLGWACCLLCPWLVPSCRHDAWTASALGIIEWRPSVMCLSPSMCGPGIPCWPTLDLRKGG